MENNKKTLILSIVGILVLVIAVIGVSFAMFTFSGVGTKENVIQTGTVSMEFDDEKTNFFELENKYPMTDANGIQQTDDKAGFAVTADWGSSAMTINYDVIMSNVTPGATLTADYIKVVLKNGSGDIILGEKDGEGNLTAGVKVSTLPTYDNQGVTGYKLTSGTMTTSGAIDEYTLSAYVSDDYKLPVDTSVTGGENEQKVQTKSETFSFKISIVATQV